MASSDSDSSPKSPSSSDGVLVELPAASDPDSREGGGILVNIDGSTQEGREDMFVDASEELMARGGVGGGGGSSASLAEEYGESSGERPAGGGDEDDPGRARGRLEETLAQCRKYKEEREAFGREVSSLRRQLRVMIDQQSLPVSNNEEVVERLRWMEGEGGDDEAFMSPTPLHSMIGDCSKLMSHLKSFLDEHLNSEGTIRELHSILYTKDQELEDLSVKLTESDVSRDVVFSYFGSLPQFWSESLKQSTAETSRRLLASLETVVGQESSSLEDSVDDGISLVEKRTLSLVEKHAQLLSDTHQLKHFLAETKPDLLTSEESELGSVYSVAREELLESKRRESSLLETISKLEKENRTISEEVDRMKEGLEMANAETNKTKRELEQSDNKLTAAREKLSMAVTKGKSLVQQRDSLKHSLAEKTSELEKCLLELQQKSSALEAAEACTEELKQLLSKKTGELEKNMLELQQKSSALEAIGTSGEEMKQLLAEKTSELEKCLLELQHKSEILEATEASAEELKQSLAEKNAELDRCLLELRQKSDALENTETDAEELKLLLAGKTSEFENCLMELQKKSNALEATEVSTEELKQTLAEKTTELEKSLLELQQKSDALEISEARVEELNQSLAEKTNELSDCLLQLEHKSQTLQLSTITSKELNETQNLVTSLRDSLQYRDRVLQDIEEVMQRSNCPDDVLSLDVLDRVRWFVDKKHESDGVLVDVNKVKETLSNVDLPETVSSAELVSQIDWLVKAFSQTKEDVAKMQEEIAAAQVTMTSHEPELSEACKKIDQLTASLLELKQEKEFVQDTYKELKCKYERIAERLSQILSEMDELAKEDSSGSTLDDQLSRDKDKLIDKYIGTITGRMKRSYIEREHFEEMHKLLYLNYLELMLCEKMLEEETVCRSEMTTLSDELGRASEEVITLRNDKEVLQKENERLEERSSLLREKLSMAVKKGKGLVQEREGFKQSLDEKNSEIEKLKQELQLQKSSIAEYEEQLKSLSSCPEHIEKLESEVASLKDLREQNERSLQESNNMLQKLVDSLEDIALPTGIMFENPIEKVHWIAESIHESEANRAHREHELVKVKEEATMQASRLADLLQTIKTLEDELSKAEQKIHYLGEEKNEIQLGKANVEQELKNLKEEGYMQVVKLQDAYATIRSLEDALAKASSNISALEGEKDEAETRRKQEVAALNVKLAECMEELVESRGALENQSAKMSSQLGHLRMLIKNQSLFSIMTEELRKKVEALRHMGFLIQDLHDQFAAKGLHIYTGSEQVTAFTNLSTLPKFEDFINDKMFNNEMSTVDLDDPTSLTKIAEALQSQDRNLSDKFEKLSRYLDDHIAVISEALQTAKNEVIHMLELSESLKLNISNLEDRNHAQEFKILSLEKAAMTLFSACTDATQELQIEFGDMFGFDMEQSMINSRMESRSLGDVDAALEEGNGSEYAKAAETLLLAAKRINVQSQQLVNVKRAWDTSIDDLTHKLNEADLTAKSFIQDRQLSEERILKLEGDLEALQTICKEMKLKIENYQAKEDSLKDEEAQLSLQQNTLATKERGMGVKLFSESQLETFIDKVDKIPVPFHESLEQNREVHFTSPVDKLFYILDNFLELVHKMDSLSIEKEDLQLILESHVREIEHQKKAAETTGANYRDLESKKMDLIELTIGLEKMVQRFGGKNLLEDQKPTTAEGLLALLERLMISSNVEIENSKSRMQELGAKLHAKEKVVDELLTKNKLLEDSIHARLAQPDTVKERTVFEASTSVMGSEISEIEDVGAAKSSISPSAAHVRTLRKGSSDHLVLSIDPESDRLIASRETDDKGHVFKSLNTSGLIPKQGKLFADRIDGIWVSGGQVLMRRPEARLGLIVYSILLHLWLLGTIL
ncbi:golgin subfamily B member 1 isoform X1 [Iris pallida]|uniref:Golgin subfamily B member 1 isoform X1 n=1 Tax=Iris pallida TaxID=29817 RepID=A0AAX6G7U9_IRIPA|nr:golgin subfamily B member 1 isoform X1 [Iris pallida]